MRVEFVYIDVRLHYNKEVDFIEQPSCQHINQPKMRESSPLINPVIRHFKSRLITISKFKIKVFCVID